MYDIIENWKTHVQDFPVMSSFSKVISQVSLFNQEEMVKVFVKNLTNNLYVSVHSVEQRNNETYNKIYIDIDSKDLQKAFTDAKTFAEWLERNDFTYRCYFSGNKGFNFYIDFPETHIDNYGMRMNTFIKHIQNKLGLETIDVSVSIDNARISRVPYSLNTKSGRMCRPIDIHTFDYDNKDDKAVVIPLQKKLCKPFVDFFLSLGIADEFKAITYQTPPASSNSETTLQYILDHANPNISEGSRHNIIWKILLPSMVQLGWNEEQILDGCKTYYTKVFNKFPHEEKTWVRQQIKLIKYKQIYPMRLDNFRMTFGLTGI